MAIAGISRGDLEPAKDRLAIGEMDEMDETHFDEIVVIAPPIHPFAYSSIYSSER